MTALAPLPKDHPIMIAWEKYKASDQYANAFQWAHNPDHRDGSMWNAFLAGFDASYGKPSAPHLSQGAVRVKPLEWVRGWMNAEAQSAIGLYIITYRRDGSFDWHAGDHNGWASSWDEAKAAAQAHYERRILSALSPAPVGVTDEMVEIVAKKVADFLGYAWEGLNSVSVVEQGYRMFTHGQFGWSFHGGQPDLRNVARDLLEATLASHEPAPTDTDTQEGGVE